MLQQAAEWPPVAFMVDMLAVVILLNDLETRVCNGLR